MLVKQKGKCRAWEFLVLQIISSSAIDNNFYLINLSNIRETIQRVIYG